MSSPLRALAVALASAAARSATGETLPARSDGARSFGDMRSAFYAGYDDSDREYILLGDPGRRIVEGTPLMSTTFGNLC
ncbi:hypothetical protein AB0J47_03000 [Nocardia sp. NPDC049737]|uniref:hypothetical protein n=1 Tax=Nocardia sp. NPDC049737 TaxID=3154358 RepID=UPI00343FEFF6